jgi:hypothetical protein
VTVYGRPVRRGGTTGKPVVVIAENWMSDGRTKRRRVGPGRVHAYCIQRRQTWPRRRSRRLATSTEVGAGYERDSHRLVSIAIEMMIATSSPSTISTVFPLRRSRLYDRPNGPAMVNPWHKR